MGANVFVFISYVLTELFCTAHHSTQHTMNEAKVQKIVLLDNFYNNEWRKDSNGNMHRFHYLWNDTAQTGFSILGKAFTDEGAQLQTLEAAPATVNLSKANIYIIADPDNVKDNPAPNYMNEMDAETIAAWVKQGGVLVLMANDSANCDLEHLNILANKFGIHFSYQSTNAVKNDLFEMGAVRINAGSEIFRQTKKIYLKDISVINIKQPAKAILTDD